MLSAERPRVPRRSIRVPDLLDPVAQRADCAEAASHVPAWATRAAAHRTSLPTAWLSRRHLNIQRPRCLLLLYSSGAPPRDRGRTVQCRAGRRLRGVLLARERAALPSIVAGDARPRRGRGHRPGCVHRRPRTMESREGYGGAGWILYRVAFNAWRKRSRRAARAVQRVVSAAHESEDPFDSADARTMIGAALEALTPRQRAVLVLTELVGMTSERGLCANA